MRRTLELFLDLLGQVRELTRVELSLLRAEISERASGIPSACGCNSLGSLFFPWRSVLFWSRVVCSFCVSDFLSISRFSSSRWLRLL